MLKIAFIGPSGAGKSVCFSFVKKYFSQDTKYFVWRLDVALPLRQIQTYIHQILNLPYHDDPYVPETYRQNGQLLSFIARHYEYDLLRLTRERLGYLKEPKGRIENYVLVNTDCRNNAAPIFKDDGFYFVKLQVNDEILKKRRAFRGDLTQFDPASTVEQINQIKPDFLLDNNGSLADLEQNINRILAEIVKSGETKNACAKLD